MTEDEQNNHGSFLAKITTSNGNGWSMETIDAQDINSYVVDAYWDEKGNGWIATSDNIGGSYIEAESFDK